MASRWGSERMQTALARHWANQEQGMFCSDLEANAWLGSYREYLSLEVIGQAEPVVVFRMEPLMVALGRMTLPW